MAPYDFSVSIISHFRGGAMSILRAAAVTAGTFLVTTIAFAVGDIPTMYTGSFPSTTYVSSITGTFNGTSLELKGFAKRRSARAVTGRFACGRTSPTQTSCPGTLTADNDPTYNSRYIVTITWNAGQPVAMTGHH
jgi:hypothetical protein